MVPAVVVQKVNRPVRCSHLLLTLQTSHDWMEEDRLDKNFVRAENFRILPCLIHHPR